MVLKAMEATAEDVAVLPPPPQALKLNKDAPLKAKGAAPKAPMNFLRV